jgi:purine nucleoside permease
MKTISAKIIELDYVLTGTISKRYGPCGKTPCRCAQGEKYWHGPYYIWTRKENDKTITKSLSPEQAKFCKKAIINTKKLTSLIAKWRNKSLQELENQ